MSRPRARTWDLPEYRTDGAVADLVTQQRVARIKASQAALRVRRQTKPKAALSINYEVIPPADVAELAERAKLLEGARRKEPEAIAELWRRYRCRLEVAR